MPQELASENPKGAKPSRFLTQLEEAARRHGFSKDQARELVQRCRRFILFEGKQHPREIGRSEVMAFLEHVAKTDKEPLRGIAAARGALEFLYGPFLQRDLGELPWGWNLARSTRCEPNARNVCRPCWRPKRWPKSWRWSKGPTASLP